MSLHLHTESLPFEDTSVFSQLYIYTASLTSNVSLDSHTESTLA